jgi:WD40 repeat-containing protein SMU1
MLRDFAKKVGRSQLMSIEIESDDVIRILQQFLHENNLKNTLSALQEETSIYMNMEPEQLIPAIKNGEWQIVLKELQAVNLKPRHLTDLYVQIVLELIETQNIGAARLMLRQTEPLDILRELDSDRYLELEGLLNRTVFDQKLAYGPLSKQERRDKIARDLRKHFYRAKPGRLMELLGQAVKWQFQQGLLDADIPLDLFQQKQLNAEFQDDALVKTQYKTINFPKKQHAEICCFSPNGDYFVVGTFDGFIEVWNYMTGTRRKDLVYQKEELMMCMDKCILALSISKDSEWLASGAQDGSIMVWELVTGKKLKHFLNAHSHGVTCVCLNSDKSLILSSGFDQVIKIHGMNSGKALKTFRGHTSFVNSCVFSSDESRIISGSSDGTVKIWNVKTSELIKSVLLQDGQIVSTGVNVPTVHTVIKLPSKDHFLISNQSKYVYLIDSDGGLVNHFHAEKNSDFMCAALSGGGEFVYLGTEAQNVAVLNTRNGKLVAQLKVRVFN